MRISHGYVGVFLKKYQPASQPESQKLYSWSQKRSKMKQKNFNIVEEITNKKIILNVIKKFCVANSECIFIPKKKAI